MEEDIPVEYDMSFSTNARINYLLWKCNQCLEQENAMEWFKTLKNIYKECSVSVKGEEANIHLNFIKKVETALNDYNDWFSRYNQAPAKIPFDPPRGAFDTLYEWELVLRKKLDKMGLLFKKGDDAYNAIM